MQEKIRRAIEKEGRKRLARHSQNKYYAQKYRRAFTKRTGLAAAVGASAMPTYWSSHKQFDPRYSIKHARSLARGVWNALLSGSYDPIASVRLEVPKAGGGTRQVDAFGVVDAAVALVFFEILRDRNAKLFSDSSYAYQSNKTPLDAIIKLRATITRNQLFVSQYDFSDFFGSIEHEYLAACLDTEHLLLTTNMERAVLRSVFTPCTPGWLR